MSQKKTFSVALALYQLIKSVAGVFFNLLNVLLGGNLPPFGCVGFIVVREGRWLVIQRPDGSFALPGGFMRWRETPEETLRREGKEETGLEVRLLRMVGFYPFASTRLNQMSTLNLVYEAELIQGTLKESIEGRPQWALLEDFQDKMLPFYQRVIQDYHLQKEEIRRKD